MACSVSRENTASTASSIVAPARISTADHRGRLAWIQNSVA